MRLYEDGGTECLLYQPRRHIESHHLREWIFEVLALVAIILSVSALIGAVWYEMMDVGPFSY